MFFVVVVDRRPEDTDKAKTNNKKITIASALCSQGLVQLIPQLSLPY